MQTQRRFLLLFLAFSFAVLSLPTLAQQVIATVPVGVEPYNSAVNSASNKIYTPNYCGNDPNCASIGTVSVIDGATNNTTTVNVGYYPSTVAVNPVTNRIYVANQCGNDTNCASDGTVTVIDGVSNTVIATITVESDPYGVAVNSVTNKIYVTNYCGSDVSCNSYSGTVSVINGANNTVAATMITKKTRVLRRDEILGRRSVQTRGGQIIRLMPQGGQRPLEVLLVVKTDSAFREWMDPIPDLDAEDTL